MTDFVLELEPGTEHDEALLPALREYVATSAPGGYRLVVKVPTGGGLRTIRFGASIVAPDRNSLEAIVAEHRLDTTAGARGDGGADPN